MKMLTFDPNHPWLTGFRSGILLALAVLTTTGGMLH